ncbi:MAG: response regulator [Lachnospiraceae bacterium]|nr:response regulator [Lachnospiraceae bacterium]
MRKPCEKADRKTGEDEMIQETTDRVQKVNIHNQELRRASAIIGSLSSMFFATYYINLEKDTFRPVTQKEAVENVLGDERNYTQGIKLYAESFICPEDHETYLKCFDRQNLLDTLCKEQSFVATEYRMLPDAQNKRAWIRASVVLAETAEDGSPKRAVYVAQDVTESKQKEEREQQALREACEAANHANEAKSEFMSRMSHDIRTPMNAIIGMTAIAEKYLDDKERVADCLNKITVSSKHLLSLINEVLDMSKIESGKIELVEEEVNLADLIDNLVTMIRPVIQEKNHSLAVDIANVEHENVIGDSVRMQQIFMNILSNAAKYTLDGGKIELNVVERPSGIQGYGSYEFMFRDNGIGMSKEFLEKLFEPFSREANSRVNKIEGTGLGMAIARNIARIMNGDIVVESTLGKGTTFVVTLSFKLADVTDPNAKKKEAQSQTDYETALVGRRVLLVEDNALNREIAEEVIAQTGVIVESAADGKEALEMFEKSPAQYYDMIFMDIQMPVMNGYDATTAIRALEHEDAVSIPIIAMTANAFAEDIRMSRKAGMNEHLTKPLDMEQLMQCLRKWLA